MDVHIDNQVLSGLGTPLLVHLFVPDTVMAELCPNRVPNCEGAWCQTLFSDRTGLTRVCRVFAARGMLPGRPSHRGTFTSVPVYCEEGLPELYNPFHVAALRFYDEGGLVGELQIYYLSLFEGAKRALTDGHLIREASGVQESAAAMQPMPIDPGPPGGAGIEHMPVAISASFREKLAMQAWTAQQEIPVVIPTSYSRIYKNSDLIREAFFTVQTRVSWESCWVKATISNAPKTPDACLWIDSHPLYEEGASAWGKVIDSRPPGGLVGAASQLVALGTDGHCVHLATTSDGQAFLVLPGGFVIKGQLALTPEERGYILARHGIRREQ